MICKEDNLSICMIAKNEEKNISKCLARIGSYGFEIIVVDTGSTDKTKEIALGYTNQVFDFCWIDDFAAAKNYAVQKASNNYVMILDSDEYLEAFDVSLLKESIRKHENQVGRIQRINTFLNYGGQEENREWINRLFPKNKYYYEGKIHEQLVQVNNKPYETYLTNVRILHDGYDLSREQKESKTKRNISLLKRELLEQGKEPYLLYQLGKSYYMAKEFEISCQYFEEGLTYDLNPELEYVIDMVESYGYALINSKQYKKALAFEQIYKEFGKTADFQFLMGLIYMNNALFQDAINEFKKAALHSESKVKGVNSYAAYYNIGVIYECLKEKRKAVYFYSRCDDYDPAKIRLSKIGMDI